MEKHANAVKALEKLLWDFDLTKSIDRIDIADGEPTALHCIVKKGNSNRIIATIFDEYDYRPKYVVIRERFQQDFPDIEVNYLI